MAYSLIMLNAWAAAMTMAILEAIASNLAIRVARVTYLCVIDDAHEYVKSNLAIRVARVTHSGFCDVVEAMADRDRILPKPPTEPP